MNITKRLEFLSKFMGSSLALTLTNMPPSKKKKLDAIGVLKFEERALKLKRKSK
jgi:hypothetical protein